MKRSVIFVIFVVVAVSALLFSGKYLRRQSAVAANGQGAAARTPLKGDMAPDFTLKLLEGKGKTMQLSELKGKAVIVNFWATWCEPCKLEMPWLVELQKQYGPEGLQIIGVTHDDDSSEKSISDFARKMQVNYPVLLGTDEVGDLYGGLEGLPTSFFLDRSGKVVDVIIGLESRSRLEDDIKKSLGQGGSSDSTKTASAQ